MTYMVRNLFFCNLHYHAGLASVGVYAVGLQCGSSACIMEGKEKCVTHD